VQWDELDAKNYKDKAAVVEAFKKISADLDASLEGDSRHAFRGVAAPRGWRWSSIRANTTDSSWSITV
jgi:hypothetical protein